MTAPDEHPPLRYEERVLRSPKEFVYGTHRAMPPEQTLARIRPHLPAAGVTRVADITGLDTVGVHVAVAMRPTSSTLAVEGGKGATFEAAMTSAAMEAIERFVAEDTALPVEHGLVAEVADRLPHPAEEFQLNRSFRVSQHRVYPWTPMWDIATQRSFLVPSSLVGLPTIATRQLIHAWTPGSNGLASGNHLPEAICAGLYEVIERDATACWDAAARRGAPALRISPETLQGDAVRTVLEQLDRAEVDPVILWRPTEIDVPVAEVFLLDRTGRTGVYKGYGCHLDPEIAVVRALTEAVQGRTIFVAGARDDQFRPTYEASRRSQVFTPDALVGAHRTVSIDDVPDRATPTFHGDIAVLIELLGRAGFPHVLARELDCERFEVSVARVLVPGLEGHHYEFSQPGRRAETFRPPDVG